MGFCQQTNLQCANHKKIHGERWGVSCFGFMPGHVLVLFCIANLDTSAVFLQLVTMNIISIPLSSQIQKEDLQPGTWDSQFIHVILLQMNKKLYPSMSLISSLSNY